jgi:uncharacterized membrane protein YhaH (DUF805 family)
VSTIIVSYRREDTAWIAGRVHDRLKSHFGEDNVFMDIDSIPFGLDFREHIQDSLDRCDILVAIIGPRWATPDESGKLRLSDETDWVRIEIEAALAKKIPVIPVLIDGTTLPPPADLPDGLRNLAFRQAAPVDSGRDFHPHMDRLIKAMDKLLLKVPPKEEKEEKKEEKKARRIEETDKTAPAAPRDKTVKVEPKADPKRKDEGPSPAQQSRTALRQALVSIGGRMARGPFWVLMIATFLAMYALAVGVFILWAMVLGPAGDPNPNIVLAVMWLWVPFAVGSKRLHDADRNGLWVLIPMAVGLVAGAFVFAETTITWFFIGGAGIIGLCVLLALGFLKGTQGPNRYGPDPLEAKAAARS